MWKNNNFGESYLSDYCSSIFDQYYSKDVFTRYLSKEVQNNNSLFIVVGTDGGLILDFFSSFPAGFQSCFLCFDFPDVVNELRKKGFNDSDNVMLVPFGYNLESLAVDPRFKEFFLKQSVYLIPSVSLLANKSSYFNFFQELRGFINSILIKFNVAQAAYFIDRHLDNMPELVFQISLLKNALQGKVAVLLGGGPSVDIIFGWLKENRANIVVFAANRISSRLKQENIVPDFFVAVDPLPELLDYSREMFSFAEKSVLLTTASVATNVLSQWSGKLAYSDEPTPFHAMNIEEFRVPNFKGIGPTVMNFALQAACYMGVSSVVMAGMDFCYTDDGQCHESSSLENKSGRFLDATNTIKIETYSGRMASTIPQFLLARDVLENQIKYFSKKIDFFQVNENAAVIKGVELVFPNNLMLPLSSPAESINNINLQLAWSIEKYIEHLDYVESIVLNRIKTYKLLLRRVVFVLRRVKRLRKLSANELGLISQQVAIVKNQFETKLGADRFVLFEYAYFDYIKMAEGPLDNSASQTLKDIQKVLITFFGAAIASLRKMIDRLDKTKADFSFRRSEVSDDLSEKLVDGWLSRKEPGRGRVWISRNPNCILTAEQKTILHRADKEFNFLLENEAPSFKDVLTDKTNQLNSLWQQIVFAHQLSDTAQLGAISHYLSNQIDDDFRQFNYYVQMLIAFINKNWHETTVLAEKITLDRLIVPKNKLLVKLHFANRNLLATLPSLEVLCQHEPKYFSIYAEIASDLGMLELAEFAYKVAVQKHPTDNVIYREVKQWAEQHKRIELLNWLAEFAASSIA